MVNISILPHPGTFQQVKDIVIIRERHPELPLALAGAEWLTAGTMTPSDESHTTTINRGSDSPQARTMDTQITVHLCSKPHGSSKRRIPHLISPTLPHRLPTSMPHRYRILSFVSFSLKPINCIHSLPVRCYSMMLYIEAYCCNVQYQEGTVVPYKIV